VIEEYRILRGRGGASLKGPFFPKSPERIVKRTVRGMLSHRQGRGNEALKRVICHNNTPKEYEKAEKFDSGKEKKSKVIKLKELSKAI
jgi:large subunit ribosomal protein L13